MTHAHALSSTGFQYHALALQYEIKKHDRLAVSKMTSQLMRGTVSSPLAAVLLIRYIAVILRDPDSMAPGQQKAALQFVESSLRHKSEMVIYEAGLSWG